MRCDISESVKLSPLDKYNVFFNGQIKRVCTIIYHSVLTLRV